MNVLGVDPGFANFGWCVAEVLSNGKIRPIDAGVIVTEKTAKKLKVLSPDDEFRRSRELYLGLRDIVCRREVRMVSAEGMSSPRNAATVRMLGYAWGVIASICEHYCLPLAQVNPKQLKKKICGRMSVTDLELHNAVRKLYPEIQPILNKTTIMSKQEHGYDALSAIEACRDGELFRTLVVNLPLKRIA